MSQFTIPSWTIKMPKMPNKAISAWNWAKTPMNEVNIPKIGNVGGILTKGASKLNGIAEATKQGELFASKGKTIGRLASGLKTLKGAAAVKGASALEALKGVPKVFAFIPAALETLHQIPEMFEGFKEGRGGAQIGNSAMDVAGVAGGAWGGYAAGSALATGALGLATAIGLISNPVGWVVGGVALAGGIGGAIAGTKIGKKIGSIVGKFFFGENHKTKMQPQQIAQQQTPAHAANPYTTMTNGAGMNPMMYNPMMMPGFFDLPPQDQMFVQQLMGIK